MNGPSDLPDLRNYIRGRRAALAGFMEQGAALALDDDVLTVTPRNAIYIRYLTDNRGAIAELASVFYSRRIIARVHGNEDGGDGAASVAEAEGVLDKSEHPVEFDPTHDLELGPKADPVVDGRLNASTDDERPSSRVYPERHLNGDKRSVRANREDIRRFLDLIAVPDGVFEIRALNVPGRGTVAGYFDVEHIDEAVEAAASLSGRASGVYVTLNPVDPRLRSRAANRLRDHIPRGESVSDANIVRRRFIPIDFDYDRPAGVSTTDNEHKLALDRMRTCADTLESEGISALLIADSGNGGHNLLGIDLPNDPANLKLIERVFKAIRAKFGNPPIKFDVTNSNAARIWKVYGTLAAKGDDNSERPHRWRGYWPCAPTMPDSKTW